MPGTVSTYSDHLGSTHTVKKGDSHRFFLQVFESGRHEVTVYL